MSGVLVAVSAAATTRIQKEQYFAHQGGQAINGGHWERVPLWWYPGLAMFNWSGITDPDFHGASFTQSLGEYLQNTAVASGIPSISRERVAQGPYLGPLRDLLRRVGVPVWIELTVGSSYREYRALDAYVRVLGSDITSPEEEAHYVLNTEIPPGDRYVLTPEQ